MSRPTPTPQPWPLKWVALVILVCLAAYTLFTLLTLDNRKTASQTHEPYAEYQTRAAAVQRLNDAGYTLVDATTERPASPEAIAGKINLMRARATPAPAGLPNDLAIKLPLYPTLPDTILDAIAPATVATAEPYEILYTCNLPNNRKLLGKTLVYIKDNELYVVTNFDNLYGDLTDRTTETPILLTIPQNTFAAGRTYTVTLAGKSESRRWTVVVH